MNNSYYPILLNLKNKKCLIVGGGNVAEKKFKKIYSDNVFFKIVSPKFKKSFMDLIKNKKNILIIKRRFNIKDLNKIFLVISATNKKKINEKICEIANKKNILCNCVRCAERNFLNMAHIDLNDIKVYITSAGKNLKKILKIKKIIKDILVR